MSLFHFVYQLQVPIQILLCALALGLWFAAAILLRARTALWRGLNLLGFAAGVVLVLAGTILTRGGLEARVLELRPFRLLEQARRDPELYRSVVLNVALFLPLGMTLPFLLPKHKKWWRIVLVTALAAACFSVTVEAAQYMFCLGHAETDDVICNLLGAVIGTCPYSLISRWRCG